MGLSIPYILKRDKTTRIIQSSMNHMNDARDILEFQIIPGGIKEITKKKLKTKVV